MQTQNFASAVDVAWLKIKIIIIIELLLDFNGSYLNIYAIVDNFTNPIPKK